jgi:hypothetical protein
MSLDLIYVIDGKQDILDSIVLIASFGLLILD